MRSGSHFSAVACHLLAALTIAFLSSAHAANIESGHSAIWFDPTRDGEGLTLQILDDDRAVLALFTFDDEGGQRWMLDVGQIVRTDVDAFIQFPTLTVTRGGRFGETFDPADVVREVVGEATLRFADCNTGTLVYTAFGQTLTIPLQRLTRTMGAGCASPNGIPGEPVRAYAGESGSWFDLSHDGEGFLLQWLAQDEAVVVWYTYDSQGKQYWLFGSGGKREGDSIVFPRLNSARGGRFGAAFDPADVELVEWGQLELEINCSAGTVRYASDLPEFGSGTQTLTRLLQLQRPACPWVTPKLSDLYDISVIEIPIARGTPMDPNLILAHSVADDGTVAGTVAGTPDRKLLRWRIGDLAWQVLSEPMINGNFALISPSGDLILANERLPSFLPVFFRDNVRETLPGLNFSVNVATGASENLEFVVGKGRGADTAFSPWIWNAVRGEVILQETPETRGSEPRIASNDGSIVGGYRIVPRCGPTGCLPGGTAGVRWVDGNPAQFLLDSEGRELGGVTACSADCRVLFGADSLNESSVQQAYYWKSPTESGYLGTLPGTIGDMFGSSYFVADVSADGSLAVGRYNVPGRVFGDAIQIASGGLIWTQSTGMIAIYDLMEEIGHPLDWDELAAVSVSSSGEWILLQGERKPDGFQIVEARAALLRLEPLQTLP